MLLEEKKHGASMWTCYYLELSVQCVKGVERMEEHELKLQRIQNAQLKL